MSLSERILRVAGRVAVATAGLLLTPALFTSAAFTATADEIYKSVDAQGHVVYSDRPSTAGARKTEVAVQQADPGEAARLAKERMLLKADDEQRKKQEMSAARTQTQQESIKKQACKNAREHYSYLMSVTRLFVPGTDGSRNYYSDAQLDAMREEARRTMNAACGT